MVINIIVYICRKRFNDEVEGLGHRSGGRYKPKILTEKIEGELAHRLKNVADAGFPASSEKVRSVAYTMAKQNNRKGFSEETPKAGRKWFKGFLQRHPELTVKKATLISKPRAQSATLESMVKWADEFVEKVLDRFGITDPRNIWNVDETSMRNIPKESKYVGRKGQRLQQLSGCERAETSTAVVAINAAGETMPPLILHRGAKVGPSWTKGIPRWWRVKASPSGYICDELFEDWGEMFVSHLHRARIHGHVALTMDGHGSHVYNYPFVDNMEENDIHVILFPPHCTHVAQPLDQYPLLSLKAWFHKLVQIWCDAHGGDPLPKSAFFEVLEEAWNRAMTKHNIEAAFRVTGVFPVNPHAIPKDKFIKHRTCKFVD